MDNPIFKLEGVVHERSAETLQDFEGPLDLILFLLSKNKIEIQDIPIALILEQYLAYLEQRKQLDLEVASEFITMAAHLMYIKTRMLLSIEDEEAQNEMEQLIQSLKERQQKDTYLRIRTLTETLGPMSEFGRNTMTKNPEPMERGKIYEYDHEKADLVLAMQSIFDRAEKLAPPPRAASSMPPTALIIWWAKGCLSATPTRPPASWCSASHIPSPTRRARSCGGSRASVSRAFCCCSAARRAAARSWRPLWRCWSCAARA